MNDLPPPSTLRALRAHLVQPQVATVMAGVAVVLGFSGPFDTWTTQSLPVRLLYWTLVVWLTYGAGFVITRRVAPYLRNCPVLARTIAIATAVAVAVFGVLFGLNLIFGQMPDSPGKAIASFGVILVICLVIEIAAQVLATEPPKPQPSQHAPSPILLRLPVQKRGALLSLSVRDHYVDVVTTKGRDMLLMRLGDAIRETAPLQGLQVHRSHWVGRAAVASATRRGDGAVLTLINGTHIPVSRAYMPAARDAGLLPARPRQA